ncbi:MAG: purine-nucleoside phosphorylase [Candidatus Melainabacteria bacterium]|nr:purine-nucleoside phosphorylase [Candidatus Melainabacteria bacterium]
MSLVEIKNSNCKRAIILGSGVSVYEGKEPVASIPYAEIPNWPLGKVKGHKGVLDIYDDLWVLRGRAHLYEGFTWQQACFPTQFLIDHGIEELIVTNSAGGINPKFEIGDLMQITGYLDFIKPGKARGNLEALTQKTIEFQSEQLATNHHGVYVAVHGPNYESDAEVSLFRNLGADAVGMSTAPEIETAVKAGIKITAVSIITNVYGKTEDLGHEGVLAAAKSASAKLTNLLGID